MTLFRPFVRRRPGRLANGRPFRLERRRKEPSPTAPARLSPHPPGTGLEICPGCHGPWVAPVEPVLSGHRYWIRLRCGQCEAEREVLVAGDVVERFDGELRRSMAQIEEGLASVDELLRRRPA